MGSNPHYRAILAIFREAHILYALNTGPSERRISYTLNTGPPTFKVQRADFRGELAYGESRAKGDPIHMPRPTDGRAPPSPR